VWYLPHMIVDASSKTSVLLKGLLGNDDKSK
jgi:hypothetical protein